MKETHSRIRLFIIFGIALILMFVGAAVWYTIQSTSNVKTFTVTKQTLKDVISISGTVESEYKITLKSETSGIVVKKLINENIRVPAGTPLLIIDPKKPKLQLNMAKINALSSRTQLQTELANAQKALADARFRHNSNVESLNNQIKKARSVVVFLEKEIKRNERLLREVTITRQIIDNQKQQLEQARIDLQSAIDNLNKIRNEKGEIIAAQNRVTQANTDLNNSIKQGEGAISIAQDALERTIIYSPFSGTMTKWLVNKGDFVTSADLIQGTPIGTFQDLIEIRLILNINEKDLPKISTKSPVDIIFDAYPEMKYKGKITWISQSSVLDNQNVQTFPIKVKFDNPKLLIKHGMSGDAQITLLEKRNVLAVPLGLINKKEGKVFVKKLEKNKVKEVEIMPGTSTLDYFEVRSGLKEGDQLVIEDAKK